MAGAKRSCRNRFCCFSSSASDEKEQDHPTSGAGAGSSPSATDNTIETLLGAQAPIPGSSNVVTPMKNEIEHVDVNINVSGTHPGGKAPVSESLRKSEGKNVNVNLNVPEAPQCNEASSSASSNVPDRSDREDVNANLNVSRATQCDDAPSSGSPNVPRKSEGEGVDANLNVVTPRKDEIQQHVDPNLDVSRTHQCDKAPLSESQNILRKSEGEDVNAHPNVSGATQCDEPSSSGSSNVPVKSEGEHVDVNPNVSEAETLPGPPKRTEAPIPGSSNVVTPMEYEIEQHVDPNLDVSGTHKCDKAPLSESQNILRKFEGEGQDHPASAGPRSSHSAIEGTHSIAPKNSEARNCEVEHVEANQNVSGDPGCSGTPSSSSPSGAKKSDQVEGKGVDVNLDESHQDLSMGSILRRMATIQSKRNPPVNRIYPEHAVGIDEAIEKVVRLLEIESEQKAVTVILHGFGGMGKTTLADAVVSKDTVVSNLVGFKYSKVRMREDSAIVNLQKTILEDLMEPGDLIPNFRIHDDGQRELRKRLEQVQAFIYIDDVFDRDALENLLPQDMSSAMKVRLLLTARNEDVKYACPRLCTEPKIYRMQEIPRQAAKIILKREIKDGINQSQLNNIIDTCGGIPLMLTLAATFIGRAPNKQEAYSTLVLQKNKWASKAFKEMHYAFAFKDLPDVCKDSFLDICSYFKGWDWDTVEDIVGKDELRMLESRALVTRTTKDVASVHDVILTLARQESKEVRLAFTSARKLAEFLEEQVAEGIKGIWLSDNKDVLEISAATLDLMSKSLRVLRLGNLTRVKGKCSERFQELVFFEANVRELPFHDVSKLKKLRYLSYQPKHELKLSKMPSSLRHMEFDGSSLSDAFQIHSLPQLEHLRILRLLNFSDLKYLPKKLGDQVKGLHELSLSGCRSITKLPDSISRLQSLRVLKMDGCSRLTELPVDFGSLSSLSELHLDGCENLKALPDSADKLSSLTLLDLSGCRSLLNLPPYVGNLTRLVELNLYSCERLQSIPEGIGELKLLRALGVSWCEILTELPDGLCNLSFITHLSFNYCSSLEKLPDRFGQLASLKVLLFENCESLQKLPESFGQLKNLEVLDLGGCGDLRELCNDFHCLSSLQILDLNGCGNLEKLPLDFHCLTSLQHLDLSWCRELEGKSMDHVVKMNRLQVVHIEGSKQLVDRWAEIERDGGGSWSFTVISGQDLSISRVEKENIEKSLLLELDGLLTNRRGEHFHLSHLPPNTLILVTWELVSIIEEMIDEMQIRVIYIGPDFDDFSTKVKDNIFVVDVPTTRATQMLEKVHLTLDLALDLSNEYLQIDTRMQVGDEYRPCWRFLTAGELEEFVASNCKRYLRLKELEAERDEESSNIELLTELFAPQGDETTPVFQKNESSVQEV